MNKIAIILVLSFCTHFLRAQNLPHFTVRAVQFSTISDQDRQRMLKAIQVFENVMNDKEFQKALLDTTFLFDLPDDPMRTLTTKQIVDTLYSGKEWYHNSVDNTADIIWYCTKRKRKPPFTTAIGYGLENDSIIHTYIFFLRGTLLSGIVANLAHEWSHKVGFDHQDKDYDKRDESVPYLFGNLVERFAKKYDD
jgi:hypothetical protein